MRKTSMLLLTTACMALTSACATAQARLSGPLLMQSLDPSMNAAINGAAMAPHLAVVPVPHPANDRFTWQPSEVPRLLAEPRLARVELPAPGETGTVVNEQGMCLTQLSPLWGPYWFDCEDREGQRWAHRHGALWTTVDGITGFLSFVPNYAADGRWIFLRAADTAPTTPNVRLLGEHMTLSTVESVP